MPAIAVLTCVASPSISLEPDGAVAQNSGSFPFTKVAADD
jgi:hypothetical protein